MAAQSGLDKSRVAEVFVKSPNLSNSKLGTGGTGYRITNNLLLTANHVVALQNESGDEPLAGWVRFLGQRNKHKAKIVHSDNDNDIALLQLDFGTGLHSNKPKLEPIKWGRLYGSERIPCEAIGFPVAQERGQVRDTEKIKGEIELGSASKRNRLTVHILGSTPLNLGKDKSPWQGMSGAALFSGSYLVGIIIVDPKNFNTDRLEAVPVYSFSTKANFTNLVIGKQGTRLTIHPISSKNITINRESPSSKSLLENVDAEKHQENTQIKITQEYIDYIRKNYGKLLVLGQANPKPIDEIYTTLNVLGKVTAFKRYAPEKLSELFRERHLLHEKHERRDGLELVNEGNNLFILGKPGAGKTTFLKYIAIKTSQDEFSASSKIPIFISLHNHSRLGKKIIESIKDELFGCGFPTNKAFIEIFLNSGRALILFDGLDEIKKEGKLRSNLIEELKNFIRIYHKNQFIITCRVAATQYTFENVIYVEMADFDEKQMQTFVNNWFRESKKLARNCWENLNSKENEGLREMGRIPLLLGLLCLTYEGLRHFPQKRTEVYQEAIEALLKTWDNNRNIERDRIYKSLALKHKLLLLEHAATITFRKGEFLIERDKLINIIEAYLQGLPEVKEEIDGEVILHAIAAQHGMFVERAHKLYSFAHLSFQEYFVAKSIKRKISQNCTVDNTLKEILTELLTHITNDQWREVFLLTTSLFDKQTANEFFELFLKAIGKMVDPDKNIQELLVWTNNKTKQTCENTDKYKEYVLRFWHIARLYNPPSFLFNISPPRLDYLFHHLNVGRSRNTGLQLAVTAAINIVKTLDNSLRNTVDVKYEHSINLAYARASTLSRVLDIDTNVANNFIINKSDKDFIKKLLKSEKFIHTNREYLKVNQLLIDCLELTSINNKQSMLNRLALPASNKITLQAQD